MRLAIAWVRLDRVTEFDLCRTHVAFGNGGPGTVHRIATSKYGIARTARAQKTDNRDRDYEFVHGDFLSVS